MSSVKGLLQGDGGRWGGEVVYNINTGVKETILDRMKGKRTSWKIMQRGEETEREGLGL